jgi:hypothetical protein
MEGRGKLMFTPTFTLWSNGTYSTGQALPHQGEGKLFWCLSFVGDAAIMENIFPITIPDSRITFLGEK